MDQSTVQDPTPAKAAPFIRARGVRFPKDADLITPRIRASLRGATYEARAADTVLKLVQPDDRVLELGAGIGFLSALMATKSKASAVHAVEAHPDLCAYGQKMLAANDIKTVTLHQGVLGSRKGDVAFFQRRNILTSSLTQRDGAQAGTEVKAKVLNPKTLMKQAKPTVLICDIEGAEAEALKLLDLGGLRAAVVKMHPQWIGEDGVRAVFETLMQAGLTYFPRRSSGTLVCFRKGW